MSLKSSEIKKLGQKIKKTRIDKKLTQMDLAALINKDQQSIQRLEAGRVNPTYFFLFLICSGLGISVADLIRDI